MLRSCSSNDDSRSTGDEDGGDGDGCGGEYDDNDVWHRRVLLPRELGVSRAAQAACNIDEQDCVQIGAAGVRYVNAYFDKPLMQRTAEPGYYCKEMFRQRAAKLFGLCATELEQAREQLAAKAAASTAREVAELRQQLNLERTRHAAQREVFDSLQGRLKPAKSRRI
jgi:hypothetical protein